MFPDLTLKSSFLGGFEKKSVEECFQQLIVELNRLEANVGLPLTEFNPLMFKKATLGQGYEKASVLTYLDSLNQRILELEEMMKN